MCVFQCVFCGGWHIGRHRPWVEPWRRR
jgi:hypothetical protein